MEEWWLPLLTEAKVRGRAGGETHTRQRELQVQVSRGWDACGLCQKQPENEQSSRRVGGERGGAHR